MLVHDCELAIKMMTFCTSQTIKLENKLDTISYLSIKPKSASLTIEEFVIRDSLKSQLRLDLKCI